MKKKSSLFFLAVLMPVFAFSQFSISGEVLDEATGQSLPGAVVRVPDAGLAQVTDEDGNFKFDQLQQRSYSLTVSFIGYETYKTEINPAVNKKLQIGLKTHSFMQDEVVVRSSRLKKNSPASFSVVDKEALQRENTGVDLPYLIQSTPSVVVTSDAGAGIGYTGIRIRGSDLSRINVTLNGVPVNDPESQAVFFVNLPDLASSIDNMQIQRGVGTSSNGAAAFGASINIQTEARSQEAYGAYQGGVGSFASLKNTLKFGTGISKNGFSLDGRLSKISSDGYIDRGWSDLKSYFLAATWSNEKTYFKLLTTSGSEKTYQSWYGIPKDSLKTNRRYNPAGEILDANGNITGYYDNQTDNYQQDYYQLHFAHQFNTHILFTGAAFLTNGRGYYDSWKNNRKFSDYGLPNVTVGATEIKRTDLIQQKWLDNSFYGVQGAAHIDKKLWDLTAGIGWNSYDGDHFGYISWAKFASESTIEQPWYFNNGKKNDLNTFVKSSLRIGRKLSAFADLQLRIIDYKIAGTHDDLSLLDQEHNYQFFNPKAGLFYQISKEQGVYASVAISNREPNRSVFRDADPGQDIQHEKLLNIEAGYKLSRSNISLETNLFYMKYQDQLVLTGKINNVGTPIMTNVPDSYRIGWESSLSYQYNQKFAASMHLSLSQNKINNFIAFVDNWNYWDDPDNQPYQFSFDLGKTDISFSPSVVAGAQLAYRLNPNLLFTYQSNVVGRQYLDNTSNKDRSLDPYHIGKLAIEANIPNKLFKETSMQLVLNNLFNTEYESNGWVYPYYYDGQEYLMDGYYPQAGFHWMLQLNLGF